MLRAAVGVTDDVHQRQLRAIASSSGFVHEVRSFAELTSVEVMVVNEIQTMCQRMTVTGVTGTTTGNQLPLFFIYVITY